MKPILLQLFTLLLISGTTGLHGQEPLNLPPPGATNPGRIRIPIATAREQIASGKAATEATQEEIAAFGIAATAQGWIPPDSSGYLRTGMMIRVSVTVQGKLELAAEPQRITQSGRIGLPLLQNVEVGNLDLEEAEKKLTEAYKHFYRDPLVNIEFIGNMDDPSLSPWGYVTLMGNVRTPGPISIPPTRLLTISGAVKLAGGTAASANKGSIRIFRPLPQDESVEVIRVDLNVLAREGRHTEDVRLQAGDVIFIPERIF